MKGFLSLQFLGIKPTPTPIPSSTSYPTSVDAGNTFLSLLSNFLLILTLLVLIAGVGLAIYLFRTGRLRFSSDFSESYVGKQRDFRMSSYSTNLPTQQDNRLPLSIPATSYQAEPPIPLQEEPDASLRNKPWVKLVKECVNIFNELDQLSPRFDVAGQEVAQYALSRLQESLERCGVEIIAHDKVFDKRRHQLHNQTSGVVLPPNAKIVEIVSPGFAVEQRILRPAKVRVED